MIRSVFRGSRFKPPISRCWTGSGLHLWRRKRRSFRIRRIFSWLGSRRMLRCLICSRRRSRTTPFRRAIRRKALILKINDNRRFRERRGILIRCIGGRTLKIRSWWITAIGWASWVRKRYYRYCIRRRISRRPRLWPWISRFCRIIRICIWRCWVRRTRRFRWMSRRRRIRLRGNNVILGG